MYTSEIPQDDEEHYTDAEEGYNIDTTVDMVQTNCHHSFRQDIANQRRLLTPNNTRLPLEVWSQLSQNDRLMWIKLSRETKALIIGLKFPPEPSIKSNRKIMLHDIPAFELIINIDDSYPNTQSTDITNKLK